jgi:Flp pilus assembly protein TadG
MRHDFGGTGEKLARFIEDRSGNFAIITAAILTTILLSVGLGVNTVQMVLTRSNLLNALDSAVTSTARDLTTGVIPESDAEKTVRSFLMANGGTGFASADEIDLDSLIVDHTAKTVAATASVDIKLLFPLFGAADNQKITVKSAALYSDKKVEVAMILDTTGSMRGQKIKDLRDAATNAVEELFKNQNPDNKRVRVALVPYAEGVNLGNLADRAVFDEVRGGPDLPSPQAPQTVKPSPDRCATERKMQNGSADFSDDSPYSMRYDNQHKLYPAKVNRDDRLSSCPTARLIPLTDNKDELLDAITDFSANGVTAGGIAAQWGYYMLSPNWRPVIRDSGMGDGPANYNPDKVTKVAILMTDGQFNTAFAGVPNNQTPQNRQGDKSRSYAESVCTNMKRDNIEIFTIGFALPSDEASEARGVLKNCSSPDKPGVKHFFDVSTGQELDQAFQEIIADTQRLALTQ